jgi:hypothetical protein
MKYIQLIFYVLILSSCGSNIHYSTEIEIVLERLDEIIANKKIIEGQKIA